MMPMPPMTPTAVMHDHVIERIKNYKGNRCLERYFRVAEVEINNQDEILCIFWPEYVNEKVNFLGKEANNIFPIMWAGLSEKDRDAIIPPYMRGYTIQSRYGPFIKKINSANLYYLNFLDAS